ncbi:energy transducer TonB [Alkalilimnicola ehrlichii]|nr:energy transducer TonB [Alkalilimnicola ehrlichii]
MTLFLAVVVHAMVILGVGFTGMPERITKNTPMIEVTLAERPSDSTPDDYDFLAQADQDGGGHSERAERPQRRAEPQMQGVPEANEPVHASPAPAPPPQPRQQQDVVQTEAANRRTPAPEQATPEQTQNTSTLELLSSTPQAAQYREFLEDRETGVPRYPSKRRIDARTRAHEAAAYMHDWVAKVERVGNLNYPDEARQRGLAGRLIMEVTIRPDGHLHEMRILQPSPHPALDQAAMRIVELAAPYPEVPKEVLQGNDLLVVVRTWEFLQGNQLHTR